TVGDVLTASPNTAEIALRRGPGLGTQLYSNTPSSELACTFGVPEVRRIGQATSDAIPDLILVCPGDDTESIARPRVEIRPGVGDGTFSQAAPITAELAGTGYEIRDDQFQWAGFIDIDGADPPEVVASVTDMRMGGTRQGFLVFQLDPSDGSSSEVAGSTMPLGNALSIAAGDVTGDGADDVVLQWLNDADDSIVGVSTQSSPGNFGGLVSIRTGGGGEQHVGLFALQLDSDDAFEIIASRQNGDDPPVSVLEVFDRNANSVMPLDQAFDLLHEVTNAPLARQAVAADIDNDGDLDLLLNPLEDFGLTLLERTLGGVSEFGAVQTLSTGVIAPRFATLSDVNGDGASDLLYGDSTGALGVSLASVVRGAPSGTFSAPNVFSSLGCSEIEKASFEDRNADQVIDLSFIGDCGDGLRLNSLDSQLGAVADSSFRGFPLPPLSSVAGLLDQNLDGNLDVAGLLADPAGQPGAVISDGTGRALLAASLPANNTLSAVTSVRLQSGASTVVVGANPQGLATVQFESGALQTSLLFETGSIQAPPVACDLDDDGLGDLFVSFEDGERILASSQGPQGFGSPISFNPTTDAVNAFGCGDVDENGRQDLVLVTPDGVDAVITQLSIAPEDTFPELVALRTRFTGIDMGETFAVEVIDFDRDSHLDVAWASEDLGAFVAYGMGDGNFETPISVADGAAPFP
ncbi:MAG: hypothetical protein AAF658_11125, partial [Myxococcota bacterium]